MKTKFISFYCEPNDGTYYTKCAYFIKNKFDEFGLTYDIRELPNSENNYMLNCLKKPRFILDMLNELDEPLIWIDIDSHFQRPPSIMDECTSDVGFVARRQAYNTPYCGLLYFSNTATTKKFLEDWAQRCENQINDTIDGSYEGGDHHQLVVAVKENIHDATFESFPNTVAELVEIDAYADIVFGLSGLEEKIKKEDIHNKNKIQVFYPPFSLSDHSSCGKLRPKLFHWVDTEQNIQVFIDNGMMRAQNHPKRTGTNRFGWLCESRSILPELYHKLKTQYLQFFDHFDAIFTCDEDLLSLDNRFIKALSGSNLPWTQHEICNDYADGTYTEKTKICSLLASSKLMTQGHKMRHKLAEELKDNIDIFGGVAGSPKIGKGTHASKSEALEDYMFSITIENDSYNNYFTEKITDCFANGTIPVYWGCPNIGEYFEEDGIIWLNDDFDINSLTTELYKSKIDAVKENYQIATSMVMSDDIIWNKIEEYISPYPTPNLLETMMEKNE